MQIRTRKTSCSKVVKISGPVPRAQLPRLCRALKGAISKADTQVIVDVRNVEEIELAFAQLVLSASITAKESACRFWVQDSESGQFAAMVDALGLRKDIALSKAGERTDVCDG